MRARRGRQSYDVIITDVTNARPRVTQVKTRRSHFSSEEESTYIKFESYRQNTTRGIHVALQEVCGKSALSYSQVTSCANQYSSCRESVKTVRGEVGKYQQVTQFFLENS